MKTLYELTQEQLNLYELLSSEDFVDADGEINPMLTEELERGARAIKEKAVSYAVIIKQLKAEAELIAAEKKRLEMRQKMREKNAERLTSFLQDSLLAAGLAERIIDTKAEISFRRSERVEILDEDLLPDGFFKIKREPDKTKLKSEIKRGAEIAGATLKEYQNIQIK